MTPTVPVAETASDQTVPAPEPHSSNTTPGVARPAAPAPVLFAADLSDQPDLQSRRVPLSSGRDPGRCADHASPAVVPTSRQEMPSPDDVLTESESRFAGTGPPASPVRDSDSIAEGIDGRPGPTDSTSPALPLPVYAVHHDFTTSGRRDYPVPTCMNITLIDVVLDAGDLMRMTALLDNCAARCLRNRQFLESLPHDLRSR